MFKTALALLIIGASLFGEAYNFTELRYSDATGRYTQLEGTIDFTSDGLTINYPKAARELKYKNNFLTYFENDKEVALDEMHVTQITQYFDILKLLHNGDESEFKEMFEIDKSSTKTLLKPLGSMKSYIDYIELIKNENRLKYVKLFLKNSDNISINIDDEVR